MSCKHMDKNNKCMIKNKIVDKFDCNKCLLKIENITDSIFNTNNIFGDIFGNMKNK